MKDLFAFFTRNSPKGTKMKGSTRNFQNVTSSGDSTSRSACMGNDDNAPQVVPPRKSVTLEEMILQLELEEELARREKAAMAMDMAASCRMSCVNSSDILRSARSAALNQYPRFSLDGRDALYRASFRNNLGRATNVIDGLKLGRMLHLPQCIGGESVVWCKAGVVPRLMGLDAMPIPISRLKNCNGSSSYNNNKGKYPARTAKNRRRRFQREELEARWRINANGPLLG